MSSPVLPVARSLVLCDAVSRYGVGKLHLSGMFDGIRAARFPHLGTRLVVYGQLTGGVGRVPAFLDVRHVGRDEVVRHSRPFPLHFPDRLQPLQMVVAIPDCTFPYPGVYTVELFCHNQFVCDTTVRLYAREEEGRVPLPLDSRNTIRNRRRAAWTACSFSSNASRPS